MRDTTHLDGSKDYPPSSINVTIVESKAALRMKRLGVYSATKYQRCVYGWQGAVYGIDKYNQSVYE